MSKASVNTKETHKNEHAVNSDDFLSSVKALKEAEKSAAHVLEDGKRQAAKIEALGKEKAVEIASRANEKAVAAKNEILSAGRGKTEQEVSGLHHEAMKQAEKIKAKRLNDRDVQSMSEQVL